MKMTEFLSLIIYSFTLTRYILVDSSTVICWTGPFVILGCQVCFITTRWKIRLANNVDPDQMPHDVASDLGLHCLPVILLQVSR